MLSAPTGGRGSEGAPPRLVTACGASRNHIPDGGPSFGQPLALHPFLDGDTPVVRDADVLGP
jgi:hypothetical protein